MASRHWVISAAVGAALAGAALTQSVSRAAEPSAAKAWTPIKSVDFSARHNVMIMNADGTLSRMDEPYFQSRPIAPGTWQLLSDGDYMYLIEGDKEALLIDSGYGAGNIRDYAQSLTRKPLHYVANTHSHFDHTANNAYFDKAFMSQETKDNLPMPNGSFAGVTFPRNYPIQVINEGYTFHLGNRDIEAIMLGNHAAGGTAYLDRKRRILFSGDEIMGQQGFPLHVSVERFEKMMEKLEAHRGEYDTLCAGFQMLDASWVDKYLAVARYILAGHDGVPVSQAPKAPSPAGWRTAPPADPEGRTIYVRHIPRGENGGGHPGDTPPEYSLRMTYDGATITYDKRNIRDKSTS